MSRIRAALDALLDFPDPSDVSITDPSRDEKMKESAARLIGVAADFVCVLDEEGHVRRLRERVLQFEDLTGTHNRLGKFREAAYKRIIEAFIVAGADQLTAAQFGGPVENFPCGFIKAAGMITQNIELKRLSLSDLSKRFKSKSYSNGPATLRDVEEFLRDPEFVRWSPYELQDYCWNLARMSACSEAFVLAMQLMMDFNQIHVVRLWGSFLLNAAYDMVLPLVDRHRYERLLTTLMYSQKSVPSLKDAAKDIFAALPVDGAQAIAENADVAPALPPSRAT